MRAKEGLYVYVTNAFILSADHVCTTFTHLHCANRNKSRLLFSSAEMFKKPQWQTMWTQIRLLLYEQSDLGPPCSCLYLN